MSLLARCPSCVKTYRVPHDRKEWHCKVCQSVLQVEHEAAGPALPDGEACPTCGAISFSGRAFCEECGDPMQPTAGGSPHRRQREDKKQAAGEMQRAFKRLRRLRTYLVYNLYTSYLIGLLVLWSVLATDSSLGMLVLSIGISVGVIALAHVAVHQVERNPFPVVTTLAGLWTLSAIWTFNESGFSAGFIFDAVWATVVWVLAVNSAQVTRLAKQFPDLYLARRMRGEHLSSGGKLD